jgi:hypothetical protein
VIEEDSEYRLEREILIAASTVFEIVSVDWIDIRDCRSVCGSALLRVPIVRLRYFLHWYDFDLDRRPLSVLV